ncbi:PREDICTED: uncharacterized protein LOC106810922 [Priapulus caudatus]|uniref:Uncharacterized protein LOC106810922 n=1 Tax=Priapulus caudatus TaxID=37621 RepID=A0ABM1ECG8_PRICU|nr:PREDICTED: uncharacterized protein LOC106810922 [Priapulus caudatus]XP_014669890.1 PREDICTED: uncharacterized protein LOC106810922 [Priapulus caudatus]
MESPSTHSEHFGENTQNRLSANKDTVNSIMRIVKDELDDHISRTPEFTNEEKTRFQTRLIQIYQESLLKSLQLSDESNVGQHSSSETPMECPPCDVDSCVVAVAFKRKVFPQQCATLLAEQFDSKQLLLDKMEYNIKAALDETNYETQSESAEPSSGQIERLRDAAEKMQRLMKNMPEVQRKSERLCTALRMHHSTLKSTGIITRHQTHSMKNTVIALKREKLAAKSRSVSHRYNTRRS